MSVPDFFVIGAQKCGTTTLYEDLRLHPDVVIGEKEATTLRGPNLTGDDLVRAYERLFPTGGDGTKAGEVSTRYSMLPNDPEIPRNAALANPSAKAIYIVREPVSRVISHHHHDFGLNFVGPDINEAVHSYPSLLDNTRYATQVRPWIEALGSQNVRVVSFEWYMSDRRSGLAELCSFIGLPRMDIDPGDVAHNSASTKYIAPGKWGRISQHPLYRRALRPLMSEEVRRRLNRAVLPKAPPRPEPPTAETVAFIVEQLRQEIDDLARITQDSLWWDLDQSLAKYTEPR